MALGSWVAHMTAGYARVWTLQTVHDRCEEVGDCWIWKQSLKCGRAPQACINGKGGQSVRPYIYDVLLGKSRPRGSCIGSTCNDTRCCNPEHLVWRSRSAVVASSYTSGARGTKAQLTQKHRAQAIKQGFAIIDMERATQIRMREGEPAKALALEFGLSPRAIRAIWYGKNWKPAGPMSVFNLGG